MSAPYKGGCDHIHATATADPIDNHVCHCNVCKSVTGQQSTHVAFFNYGDLEVDHPEKLARQPFNKDNPDGPLDLCTCEECGTPIMLDDKEKRIRVAVPNVMGYNESSFPDANYHAFWDDSKDYAKPDDGRPVHEGFRPDFEWPASAA